MNKNCKRLPPPNTTYIYFYLYPLASYVGVGVGVGMRRRNVFPFLTGNTNQPAGFGEVIVVAMVNILQLLNRKAKWFWGR